LERLPHFKTNEDIVMLGTIMVGVISVVAYVAGVPLVPLLLFIIVGTLLEYLWIKKRSC
jgi:hypothetical protein